jgi:hypothetical protein
MNERGDANPNKQCRYTPEKKVEREGGKQMEEG